MVLCEGDTEELAVRYFVARQWRAGGFGSVGLSHRNLQANLNKLGPFASNYLDEPDVLAVFTLIDLYGMRRVDHLPNDGLDAKVQRVKGWLRNQVDQHRRACDFFPHVSVHEVEAWILAEGVALSQRLKDVSISPDPQAEARNFLKPPKERLSDMFWRNKKTRYRETLDGQPLFSKMSFQSVYGSCRYFRDFYDELKNAARR